MYFGNDTITMEHYNPLLNVHICGLIIQVFAYVF